MRCSLAETRVQGSSIGNILKNVPLSKRSFLRNWNNLLLTEAPSNYQITDTRHSRFGIG